MQLSLSSKTHAVITFTGVHYFITQGQYNFLSKAGKGEEITVDGNILKTNNIADILTLEKYHETYPDKKLVAYQKLPNYERVVFSKAQLIRALGEIIRGFKKHFGDRALPAKSQKILSHTENNLSQAEKVSDNKTFRNPVQAFYNNF